MGELTMSRQGRSLAVVALSAVILGTGACSRPTHAALTMLVDARRLASDLHVHFSRAVDESSQAVMADTDAEATAAAQAAEKATAAVTKDAEDLRPLLESLQFADETKLLQSFNIRFGEFRRLVAEILPLAVQNTNIKAQRLAFGPAREAADAFVSALEKLSGGAKGDPRADALAARAEAAVREIQAIEPRHIAEAEDNTMTRMEDSMRAADARARTALESLRRLNPPGAAESLTAAQSALDRFSGTSREIIALSRQNSNVRSMALSLGTKRRLAAQCDDLIRQLEDALAGHDFAPTR
jgi:hypothetical protein